MLSITSILSQAYSGSVDKADTEAVMYLKLESDDSSKWVTVGMNVSAAEGSKLDPSKIEVKYRDTDTDPYTVLPDWAVLYQENGDTTSKIIFSVPAGTYQVLLKGDDETTGAFVADVYVPGGTEENPTSVDSYSPLLVQAGLQQSSIQWNPTMESVYKLLLGPNYHNNIISAHPELDVTENGVVEAVDGKILASVVNSGEATASLTKGEPTDDPLTMSAASVTVGEKITSYGTPSAAITVTGGSKTSLADYTVVMSDSYTISGGSGADLSDVDLPKLVEGTDYKFEDGEFYFNPNGKFDFIPKGTEATLTLNYTATDKTDTSLKGEGTITVKITGANDTPVVDEDEIDLTADSETFSDTIWVAPWSETMDGVTIHHSDEVRIYIDGNKIKIGDLVVGTIADPDVSDSFSFSSIGFPDGTVSFVDNVWVLKTSDDKIAGKLHLEDNGKVLVYKSSGTEDDSLFKSLETDELSSKLKFTFTVKDDRNVATSVSSGDQKSESTTVSVEFQVKGQTDPQMALEISPTGTTEVSIRAQGDVYDDPIAISLGTYFTVNYSDPAKVIAYEFSDFEVNCTDPDLITEDVIEGLRASLQISGNDKTNGKIVFDRYNINKEAHDLLNSLDEEVVDVSFKVKVMNTDPDMQGEYVVSQTLHVVFKKSTQLEVEDSVLTANKNSSNWTATEIPAGISGGVGQVDPSLYTLEIEKDYRFTYITDDGIVHPGPELVYGEDYKAEVVLVDPETRELGVVFYFNPNGKFDFLKDDQDATLEFVVHLTDNINPILSSTSSFVVTLSTAPITNPTFKDDAVIKEITQTDENRVLTLEADQIAESENEHAELVYHTVLVDVDDVEKINDEEPDVDDAVDGNYIIERPDTGSMTIELKSGSIITILADGKITFDPRNRTEDLDEYEEDEDGNPVEGTFANEIFSVTVADISAEGQTSYSLIKELAMFVKGVADVDIPQPTFKDDAEIAAETQTDENIATVFEADMFAESESETAELVFDEVQFRVDDVDKINGETPDEETADNGFYKIPRPLAGTETIKLKSGSVVVLSSAGVITFDPTNRTEKLDEFEVDEDGIPVEGTYAEEDFFVIVADVQDLDNPVRSIEQPITMLVKGVSKTPTFKSDSEISEVANTSELVVLTLEAEQIAKSNNRIAELVFEKILVDPADVAKINGEEPDVDDIEGGYYVTERPSTGSCTIELVSGSVIMFDSDGKFDFDPTGRTEDLEPYREESGQPVEGTYAYETIIVVVADISGEDEPVLSTEKELAILVKGAEAYPGEGDDSEDGDNEDDEDRDNENDEAVADDPTEDDEEVDAGFYALTTYPSLDDMPETITIEPQYVLDGEELDSSAYSFCIQMVMSSPQSDGEYSTDLSGLFYIGDDGIINVDKTRLLAKHDDLQYMNNKMYFTVSISVSEKGGDDVLFVADIPIKLQRIVPPDVSISTMVAGVGINTGSAWDFRDPGVVAETSIVVSDMNVPARSGDDWYVISEVVIFGDWRIGNEVNGYTTKSQAALLSEHDPEMQAMLEDVASLIAAKGDAFDYSFNWNDTDESWTFIFERLANSSLYDFIQPGDELQLVSHFDIVDNEYNGSTPVCFTIIF